MDNTEILNKIMECVELGKVNKVAPFPPQMKGLDGADEWTRRALDQGLGPSVILNEALIKAMDRVGQKFSEKKIFVPQMLIAAKAMNAAMAHIKPYFQSGAVRRKGVFIIGTVAGDLHDIGKNLVAMIVEGAGYEVVDLGVDVSSQKFIQAMTEHPEATVGLSALLTTTMENMKNTVREIKQQHPSSRLIVGGAPVSEAFSVQIGADGYAPDPQEAVALINALNA